MFYARKWQHLNGDTLPRKFILEEFRIRRGSTNLRRIEPCRNKETHMHCYTIKRDASGRPVSIDLPVSRKEKYGLSFKNHLVLHAHGRHEPCAIVR